VTRRHAVVACAVRHLDFEGSFACEHTLETICK
jgi:hypothetical protein